MVDIELFKQKVKDILSKEIESTQFNLKNMKNKLLVIYQTQKGREIYRDWDTNYVPSKNDLISFKYVDSNLNENDKKKLHYVIYIKFQLPNTIVVTVFPQISIAVADFKTTEREKSETKNHIAEVSKKVEHQNFR